MQKPHRRHTNEGNTGMTSADAIHVMGTLAAVVMLHKPGGWPIDAVTDSFI